MFESFEDFRDSALRSGMSRDFAPTQLAKLYGIQSMSRNQQADANFNNQRATALQYENVMNNPFMSKEEQNFQTDVDTAIRRRKVRTLLSTDFVDGEGPNFQADVDAAIRRRKAKTLLPMDFADGASILRGVHQYGMVDGPGTSRSDSVGPARLPGSGEVANLSRGEAVVPTDTVNYMNREFFGGDKNGLEKMILATHKNPEDNGRWKDRLQSVGGQSEVDDFSNTYLSTGDDMAKKRVRGYADGKTGLLDDEGYDGQVLTRAQRNSMSQRVGDINAGYDQGVLPTLKRGLLGAVGLGDKAAEEIRRRSTQKFLDMNPDDAPYVRRHPSAYMADGKGNPLRAQNIRVKKRK